MKRIGTALLAVVVLSALTVCALPNTTAVDESTIATRVAANIYATQTASAPTAGRPPPTESAAATPEPFSLAPGLVVAQVTRVIDGDTIDVSISGEVFRVRYIGMDTPETVHPTKPVEWMGKEASEANKQLVDGKTVNLEKDVSETDQYGRLLRYVYVGDVFVNAELVRLGFAQVSTYPPDVKYQSLFLQMQHEAREAGRGLWGSTPTAVVAAPTDTSAPTAVPTVIVPSPTDTSVPAVSPTMAVPSPTETASPSATQPPPTATNLPRVVQPTATTAPQAALDIEVVSLTSPIAHGANATLVIRTAPGASCMITIYYKSGPSKAQGLGRKTADASGQCSWSWKVGTNTTPGTWSISVTVVLNSQSASLSIPFVVQ